MRGTKVGGYLLIYDINPTPHEIKSRILTTAIDFDDTTASLEIVMKVARDFRLSKKRAHEIIKEVDFAAKQWRQVASHFGLSKRECDRMALAFEYEKENL